MPLQDAGWQAKLARSTVAAGDVSLLLCGGSPGRRDSRGAVVDTRRDAQAQIVLVATLLTGVVGVAGGAPGNSGANDGVVRLSARESMYASENGRSGGGNGSSSPPLPLLATGLDGRAEVLGCKEVRSSTSFQCFLQWHIRVMGPLSALSR